MNIENKITPEEYNKIIKGIALKDIRLISNNSNVKYDEVHLALSNKIPLKIHIAEDIKNNISDGNLIVTVAFKVTCKHERRCLFNMNAVYEVRYQSSEKINQEFADMFSTSTVSNQIWPFLRDWIATTTLMMGVPRLLIGLRIQF